jgi:hypothetical protein
MRLRFRHDRNRVFKWIKKPSPLREPKKQTAAEFLEQWFGDFLALKL